MSRVLMAMLLAVASCDGVGGEGGPTPDPEATPCALVTAGMGLGWEKLNHRVSWMKLEPGLGGCEGDATLDAAFIGGDFTTGDVMTDAPAVSYLGTTLEGQGFLGAHAGSVALTLTAPAEEASADISVDLVAAHLTGFDDYVVLVNGFEIRTDVPQTDSYPDNGYDPAHGYTTLGHGAGVSAPTVNDDTLEFTARLRAAWGPSDREDMNAALAHATVEGAVHYLVLGITGGAVTEVENIYRLDYAAPVPLEEQVIEPAGPEDTRLDVPVDPFLGEPVLGWRSFDLRLDPDGDADPDADGPVGYYLRSWSVKTRVLERRDDEATIEIAGNASNASGFIAYYPLVLVFSGEVLLIQLPGAASATPVAVQESFETGAAVIPLR